MAFSDLARDAFSDDLSGFETMKEFALHIEGDASRDDSEAVSNSTFSKFASSAPGLERIILCKVPVRVLSLYFWYLYETLFAAVPFPDLQRLHVEFTPLRQSRYLKIWIGF